MRLLYNVAPYTGKLVSFSGDEKQKPKNRFQPARILSEQEYLERVKNGATVVKSTPEKGITEEVIKDLVNLGCDKASAIAKKLKGK